MKIEKMRKVDKLYVKTLFIFATNILSSTMCVLTGVNPDTALRAADEEAGSIFL